MNCFRCVGIGMRVARFLPQIHLADWTSKRRALIGHRETGFEPWALTTGLFFSLNLFKLNVKWQNSIITVNRKINRLEFSCCFFKFFFFWENCLTDCVCVCWWLEKPAAGREFWPDLYPRQNRFDAARFQRFDGFEAVHRPRLCRLRLCQPGLCATRPPRPLTDSMAPNYRNQTHSERPHQLFLSLSHWLSPPCCPASYRS